MAGSRVLITGGGDGIGFFMAVQLLEDGHRVAVLDLNTGKLEALAGRF
ncbi:MAG: SDR family NAD(P)-dependent oxidoreductase, partial [Bacillota bacterium]